MRTASQHEPLAQFIQAFRHDLHRHPELSNQEFETTKKIRAVLEKEGIRILDLPLKTGLVAEVGGLQEGPLVVVRSDIDALPIEEESGVEFTSLNKGVMHACGHDFHSSAALGAAILLKKIEPELKGTVRILFQAAEETGLGAPEVIAVGALDDAVAIFGIHNDPTLPVGVIGGKDGALTAGVDRFEIKIAAKGCHAAKPHEGNDPIIILGQLISAVQTIISRTVSSDNNAVVSITQVHSGSTWNVIPDTAYVEGTVRTFNQAARDLIEQRFRQIVAGIASTFGAEIEFLWHAGPPSVINTPEWVEFALNVASDEGFEARRVEASPIGEDFAFYQQKLPGTFMMVGSGGPYALHHPKFRVDDSALFPTAHYLYQVAKQSLEQLSSR
ncbi:M20 peptidase aminoacylase family protein [Pectobacterium carotovorum]|uniref:M20 peptidase aminoacylase family protein n=1 Tax=Pectobacterium carotovorum TaxID=554 RepID=UPI00057CEBBD|nr:M20 peptidase aminoacylase family protein [Pectobacterium carotovorum]KAA3669130.1 amidohydrolase [Pectobacterium carotovorum subsp. carotovorum]KHT15284.1 hydrolase [Pectobacterium carotovorum subsp. carotovorum]KHT28999.1 hydrolase [Pectobacterium carotovorum subsp. carotovorum]MBA0194432.1 M20 peptidase aminoacylase family protein [Pectobacterium carotovorum]MBA0199881.1 M20 peptidase aminoacylase family protein [Pectobacterium carotovorum]